MHQLDRMSSGVECWDGREAAALNGCSATKAGSRFRPCRQGVKGSHTRVHLARKRQYLPERDKHGAEAGRGQKSETRVHCVQAARCELKTLRYVRVG